MTISLVAEDVRRLMVLSRSIENDRRAALSERRRLAEESLRTMERDQARSVMLVNGMPKWARDLVFSIAEKHGVSPREIMVRNRYRKVVNARREAIYEVRSRKSHSQNRIAAWFGQDHTTIAWAIVKYAKENGLPQLTGYDVDRRLFRIETYKVRAAARRRLVTERMMG